MVITVILQMTQQSLQSQEAVIQPVSRHQGAHDNRSENQLLDVGENRFVEFKLGLGEQNDARRVEQG
ncbi:hypothetical protein D3C73_1633070 [compost metagenome]